MANELIKKDYSIQNIIQNGEKNVNINHVNNVNIFSDSEKSEISDNGKIKTIPISSTRYNPKERIIYVNTYNGTEEIKLPKSVQPNEKTDNKMPYIKALYEVYSEKLDKKITKSNLKELPKSLSENLKNQKEAFYNATSVGRAVSEVFCDGVEQFELLKEEAYEGIEPTYHNDNYKTGYDRLLGVLEKITNTTLDKSNLMNIKGLIGNSEKKGICHILVNDKKINSWVDINE